MKKLLLASVILLMAAISIKAQDNTAKADTDSLVESLQAQLREMKLREMMLTDQLTASGEAARQDSVRQAERQKRIDSLRQTTRGIPVVIEGDTLFTIFTSRGGVSAEARAISARTTIMAIGHSLRLTTDSIYVAESDYATDVMGGENVIITLTDLDGMWNGTSRQALAKHYSILIANKVQQMHKAYGLQQKLIGIALLLLIIVAQVLLFKLTMRLFAHLRRLIASKWMKQLKPLTLKDYEFLNVHQQARILLLLTRVGQILTILLQLAITIPLLFSIFPETKTVTWRLIGYVWNPAWQLVVGIVGYIPKLIQITIVFYCFRYLVRFMRYMAGEIENGKLRINGFYPEWAKPTFYIIRVFAYAFMIVMIWPLLPYSDSGVFKGISVFLGVIVSFSSSSVISNMVSGIVMTYMRPFRIGDFIRFEDNEGEVIEKTVLVTRIRTLKNDIITIPNASILQAKTLNYTLSAENYGIIVHTQFTMGYDINWRTCERLLIEAALATKHVNKHPRPFVLAHALDDSYLTYEINAYTHYSQDLLSVYSELHKNVVDKFNEAGIEVMAPHIYARRDGIRRQAPDYDDKR